MEQIIYIGNYEGMGYSIYFVIENGKGYVVNFRNGHVDGLCPCCMSTSLRQRINNAVLKAHDLGMISGKTTWVCRNYIDVACLDFSYQDYGDHLNQPELDQRLFQAGTELFSQETMQMLSLRKD